MAVKKLGRRKSDPPPFKVGDIEAISERIGPADEVLVEVEPTFTIPRVPPSPEQMEAELLLSAARATMNELSRETVDKSSAAVLAIRVIQSAKRLVELLKA